MGQNERRLSTDPEPIPAREEGYYWAEVISDPGSEQLFYYGALTGNDELMVNGKLTGNRIVNKYCWYNGNPEDELLDDCEVKVLSPRIKAPSE